MSQITDLIGTAQACEILGGLDRSTVTRWVQLGKLRPVQQLPGPNGAYLFARDEIERLRDELVTRKAS